MLGSGRVVAAAVLAATALEALGLDVLRATEPYSYGRGAWR